MDRWTVEMVEERLVEAAAVMRRLPETRVQGYFNTWPKTLVEFADQVGRQPEPVRAPPPSPSAITRMEEALRWLIWLEPIDRKIVWLRSNGERWKTICWKVGLGRTAANQHWLYALSVLAWRLNGMHLHRRSRRHVIEVTRAAQS
jgi:hypothetical protein